MTIIHSLLIFRWYNRSSSASSLPELVNPDLASDQLASLQTDGTYVSLSRLRLRLQPWHDLTSLYCVASNSDLEPGTLEEAHCVDEFKLNVQERGYILLFNNFHENSICHTLHSYDVNSPGH